ncbi:MAG: 8-oxo-dGTP diphosphatase [Lachnospiraceae bacterium]|jgi:8-oxo-dGTP diphosphatase|nr:8-oxo-dGTP diphosphatase [Lachnospiraceae bacterium]
MKLTTICYLRQNGQILMLHRIKKKVDLNHGKWIGVGGKFEPGESPEECICREVLEETGLRLIEPRLRGLVTFNFENPEAALADWDTEYMFIYVCDTFDGELTADCPEGELRWVPEDEIPQLSLWEGDRIFMPMVLADEPFFSMKIRYCRGELIDWQIHKGASRA